MREVVPTTTEILTVPLANVPADNEVDRYLRWSLVSTVEQQMPNREYWPWPLKLASCAFRIAS